MPKASKNKVRGAAALWDRLAEGDFRALDERVLSDEEAKELADRIGSTASFGEVFHVIEALPNFGKTYDWNVGALVRFLEPELTVSALQHAEDRKALYESAGLMWALGRFRSRDRFVTEFLRAAVREAHNAEAWWQAAFALERLGVDDAVNLLKRSMRGGSLNSLQTHLKNLDDKRSVIAVLLLSTTSSQSIVYPVLKKELAKSKDEMVVANVAWLLGRLRIADDDILKKLVTLTKSKNFDCRLNAYFALSNIPNSVSGQVFVAALQKGDVLDRKMAARGFRNSFEDATVTLLEAALDKETDSEVTYEISKTISRLKNGVQRELSALKRKGTRFENGMLSSPDVDPSKLNVFAEARDPEGLAFGIIRRRQAKKKVRNPIDLGTATGRTLRQMFEGLAFEGTLYGVEANAALGAFADASLRRERNFMRNAEVRVGTAVTLSNKKVKSNLVVSTFGFGKMSKSKDSLIKELRAVYELLTDDGEFYTVGWDELYNDAFGAIWYKFVAEGATGRSYDEWREAKLRSGITRDGAGLTWLHRGLYAPLQFRSHEEAVRVMSYLFGRDVAQYIVRTGRKEWSMSLGITCDGKKSLSEIIHRLENPIEE